MAAVPIVTSQPTTRQALSLRSQRVLRLQAFRGATTVLVAQTATGLLRSIDDGNTFTRIDLGLPRSGLGKLRLVDWALSAADLSRVYALVGRPGQERLYRSDDDGETWRVAGRLPASRTQDSVLRTLAVASSNFAMVYVIGDRNLWRSVDDEGEVLESFVTKRRDREAALKFLKKPMRSYGRSVEIVTDRMRSYGAVLKGLGRSDNREMGRWVSNRAENSHLPFRRREPAVLRFRWMRSLQKFAAVHGSISVSYTHLTLPTNREV